MLASESLDLWNKQILNFRVRLLFQPVPRKLLQSWMLVNRVPHTYLVEPKQYIY